MVRDVRGASKPAHPHTMTSTNRSELVDCLLSLSNVEHRSLTASCVPSPGDFTSNNHSIALDGTVLFADFGGSSLLVEQYPKEFAIWLLRAYLYCATLSVKHFGGSVTAFEGDGIMALFAGPNMEDRAVRCALGIQWLVENAIRSAQATLFPAIAYEMRQVVGIDSSPLCAVRTGVWHEYDILWVGVAANVAANLTRIQDPKFSTHITETVHSKVTNASFHPQPVEIWHKSTALQAGRAVFSAGIGLAF